MASQKTLNKHQEIEAKLDANYRALWPRYSSAMKAIDRYADATDDEIRPGILRTLHSADRAWDSLGKKHVKTGAECERIIKAQRQIVEALESDASELGAYDL